MRVCYIAGRSQQWLSRVSQAPPAHNFSLCFQKPNRARLAKAGGGETPGWVGGEQGEACDPSWPSSSVWPLEACLTPTPENFTSWDFSGAPSLLWESGIYFNISNLIKMKVTLMFIHPGGTTVLTRVLKQSLPALQGHQPATGSGGPGGGAMTL